MFWICFSHATDRMMMQPVLAGGWPGKFPIEKKWDVLDICFLFCGKHIEKTKNQKTKLQTLTHQLVATWVLHFLCFLFLTKSSKKTEKTKKNKIADPNSPACRFLAFGQKKQKHQENQKNKKTKKQNCRPQLTSLKLHGSCNFGLCLFLVFLIFWVFFEKSR